VGDALNIFFLMADDSLNNKSRDDSPVERKKTQSKKDCHLEFSRPSTQKTDFEYQKCDIPRFPKDEGVSTTVKRGNGRRNERTGCPRFTFLKRNPHLTYVEIAISEGFDQQDKEAYSERARQTQQCVFF